MSVSRLFVKFILSVVLITGSLSYTVAQNYPAPRDGNTWKPQRTWVFMVGLLKWQDSKKFVSFPQKNRRDIMLLNVLRQKGVPEDQIVYLEDQEATTATIKQSFEDQLAQTRPGDWIFVYFEGHGFKNDDNDIYLASYNAGIKSDPGWEVKSIPETLERYFRGSHAIIALDDCNSGAIVDAVKNRRSRISYAALASTPSNSSSTGNWTFTESLIYAFRGDAFVDYDHDGVVTLGELKRNSYEDMSFAEEQLAQFALTGDFNNQTVITPAKIGNSPHLGERIEAYDGNDWYRAIITDYKNDTFKVHYYGYEYDEDEYLTADEIREAAPFKQFKIGDAVEAESDGKWYAAHVLNVKGGAHFVSYDDYDASENEWLPSDKIRKRKQRS